MNVDETASTGRVGRRAIRVPHGHDSASSTNRPRSNTLARHARKSTTQREPIATSGSDRPEGDAPGRDRERNPRRGSESILSRSRSRERGPLRAPRFRLRASRYGGQVGGQPSHGLPTEAHSLGKVSEGWRTPRPPPLGIKLNVIAERLRASLVPSLIQFRRRISRRSCMDLGFASDVIVSASAGC
jgi:hypothetical protein